MAHRIIWSPAALNDVDEIARFISRDSRNYAAGMVRRIKSATAHLDLFPLMGRHVPEFSGEDIREVLAPPYRIIYRVAPQEVHIAAVIHGARLLGMAMGDRKI